MAKTKDKEKNESTFEQDMERLEAITHALEEGGLPLDEALTQFEEGVKLVNACEKALCDAEKRIEILLKKADGTLEAVPFQEGAAPSAEPGVEPPPPICRDTTAAPNRDAAHGDPEPPEPDEADETNEEDYLF